MTQRGQQDGQMGFEARHAIDFESSMSGGVRAQARGEHQLALLLRTDAFRLATTDIQVGRALRDGSTSHAKLGQLEQAFEGADASVEILKTELGQELASALPQRSREYAVSLCWQGRLMIKVATLSELTGETFGMSQDDLYRRTSGADAKIADGLARLETHDQYYKDFAGRLAAGYAANGKRSKAIKAAAKAIPAALASEARGNNTSNSNLDSKGRLRAKVMHLGVAGLAIGAALAPSRESTLKFALKAVG